MKKHVTRILLMVLSTMVFNTMADTINTPVVEKLDTNKGIVFFKKARGINYGEFLHQWRDLHYPMVHLFDFDGYVQNSKIPNQPDNLVSPYDGVLTVWFDTVEAKQKTYSSPFWSVVAQHEPLLLQPDSLVSLSVDEYVVLDGSIEKNNSYTKLIIGSKKNPSVTPETFKNYWLSQHAFDVVSIMTKNEGLVRYTISTVNGLSVQQKDYEGDTQEGNYSVVEELWFKDKALLEVALKSEAWRNQAKRLKPFVIAQDSFIAEEFIGIKPISFD